MFCQLSILLKKSVEGFSALSVLIHVQLHQSKTLEVIFHIDNSGPLFRLTIDLRNTYS